MSRGEPAASSEAQQTVGGYRIRPPRADSENIAYVLVGKRGARYGLLRNEPNPGLLFAIYMDRFGVAEHVGWFTDKNGHLEQVRS